jgi:DNA-binding transcriptional MerR regulator
MSTDEIKQLLDHIDTRFLEQEERFEQKFDQKLEKLGEKLELKLEQKLEQNNAILFGQSYRGILIHESILFWRD